MPEAVKTATESYREEMDVLAGFLDDYCIIDTRMTAKLVTSIKPISSGAKRMARWPEVSDGSVAA